MKEQRLYITNLKIMREKGKPGEETDSLTLIEGQGILGDRHADGGEKQISIVTKEAVDFIRNSEEQGLCFARYKGNIEVEAAGKDETAAKDETAGKDETAVKDEAAAKAGDWKLKPGMQLVQRNANGEVVIEITGGIKKCFPECALIQEGKPCKLAGNGCYGKVVCGGELFPGQAEIFVRQESEN